MRWELFVLLVLLIVWKTGYAVKPVVTFNQNWDKIFTTESLTMTCNVRSRDVIYSWYKDNTQIHTGQSFVIGNAVKGNSGNYQCKGSNTERSDSVRLEVSNDYVILQAPLYIYEGDHVTLRCHHYPGYSAGSTIFYKDNTIIRDWGPDSLFRITNINIGKSGKYKCTNKLSGGYEYSGEASISVRELFTAPEIKVKTNRVLEGDHMTLTCDTSLSPHRQTDLQFAFYRDQRTVQNFTLSDQYGVEMAQLKDSGKYYCEAKTLNSNVKKRSDELNIKINEPFTDPEIKVSANPIEGDNITLTCLTKPSPFILDTEVEFAFQRNGQNVQEFGSSNKYGILFAKLEESGSYICEVRRSANGLTKKSKEINVQIQELFSHPEIVTNTDFPREGSRIILKCNTSIRNGIELQFAFYQNEKKVQKLNSSHQYIIPLAQLEDSGNYSCEARTLYNGMKKRSAVVSVVIQGTISITVYLLIICPVTLLLLILAILGSLYMFRQRRPSVNNQDPTTGAPVRTDEREVNRVTYSALRPKSMRRLAAAQEMSDEPESIYENT
ncbi:high affinity immunoglobulin gamma Fc receptor I-like [Rana temporaria]|uniref:high affinity immunoglobulin gamma Fc receptor I-like n=1 Tax=Rana temporaria TaxID=8407 RepID=UPI001AACD436|nr:high affinity immunoglobulin gamma Fc receptor I-like [Rana temporaria]